MRIYRIEWGCENGANGVGVAYAATRHEAAMLVAQAKRNHDSAMEGFCDKPTITTIHVAGNRAGICDLLNQETEPLRAG